MTAKQWLTITVVVVLNIIIFGALLGNPASAQRGVPTPTWTAHPTFTPTPFPTPTAIVMPTMAASPTVVITPLPTPVVHVVAEGETLEGIAEQYDVGIFVLRMVNRIPEGGAVRQGQRLIIPAAE